jgi:hypothetical protein
LCGKKTCILSNKYGCGYAVLADLGTRERTGIVILSVETQPAIITFVRIVRRGTGACNAELFN